MSYINIPTSKDIYIEVNGQKVAVIESYKARSSREIKEIEEFGDAKPIATISGRTKHSILLRRIYFIGEQAKKIDFFKLENFDVVIVKPNSRIHYTGCQWENISESVDLKTPCIEEISVSASNRIEVNLWFLMIMKFENSQQ